MQMQVQLYRVETSIYTALDLDTLTQYLSEYHTVHMAYFDSILPTLGILTSRSTN